MCVGTIILLASAIAGQVVSLLALGGLALGGALLGGGLWQGHLNTLETVRRAARLQPMARQLSEAAPLDHLPSPDRRTVTALSVRLTPADGVELEDLADCLSELADVLYGHRATITFQGSTALLAIFNAPQEQADHPSRALGAARAMQLASRAMPVQLTLGMHTGVAMVGTMQRPDHPIYTAVGAATATAVRLQALGQPGEFLLSRPVAESTRVRAKKIETDGGLEFVRLITRRIHATDDVSLHGG